MRILSRVGVVLLLAIASVLLFARGQDDWLIVTVVVCAAAALFTDRWLRRREPDDLEDEIEDGEFDGDEIGTGEVEEIPEETPGRITAEEIPEELVEARSGVASEALREEPREVREALPDGLADRPVESERPVPARSVFEQSTPEQSVFEPVAEDAEVEEFEGVIEDGAAADPAVTAGDRELADVSAGLEDPAEVEETAVPPGADQTDADARERKGPGALAERER